MNGKRHKVKEEGKRNFKMNNKCIEVIMED